MNGIIVRNGVIHRHNNSISAHRITQKKEAECVLINKLFRKKIII